jgi:hypothetical protein
MENKKNKNRIALSVVGVMLVISIVVGLTYAYWTVKVNQSTTNVINTGCLSINLTDETDAINLQDAYPISDKAAENLKPYTFEIENTCNTSLNYQVTLEILNVDNRLASKYIAANFNGEGKKLLSKFTSVDPTYDKDGETAVEARELVTGSLDGKSSISYTLNLWIDQDVTDDEAMDKNFTSKVSITIFKEQVSSKTTLVDYITTLAESDTTNLVADDGTDDNNTRYIGADPDNYLCFDKDCTNGKWRAIGVMNNITTLDGEKSLVKIVRSESIGDYAWDSNSSEDWSNASLNTYLNSDWYTEYLSSYSNLIESVVWHFGQIPVPSSLTTSKFYTYERKNQTNNYGSSNPVWTGKVALIYPSDYGYATSGGDTGRDTCLNYYLGFWNSYSDCYTNDYLNLLSYQWTITPTATGGNVYVIKNTLEYRFVTSKYNVQPSLYLVENSYIVSGNGTSESPWIVGIA